MDNTEVYLLSGDKFENQVEFDWPPPLQENHEYWRIFCSCIHGTLILHNYDKFILWNPTTKQFRIIPPINLMYQPFYSISFDSIRFGYSPVKDDFKVIRRLKFYPDYPTCWEIYSLRSNSWRKLGIAMDLDPVGDDIYMDGVSHWLAISDKYGAKTCLVSFDFKYERFRKTKLPLDLDGTKTPKCLVALNGTIALISEYAETKTFFISVLGKLGVKESWTKIFIVGPLLEVNCPIGTGKNGDIFFRNKNSDLVLFDLRTQTLKEVVAKCGLHSDRIIIYKECDLPIGRIDY